MDNIILSGGKFKYLGNSVETLDKLGAGLYDIKWGMQDGTYLQTNENLPKIGGKVYGSREEKVMKTIAKFNKSNRNLGVLLNGAKGIGKSLFTKQLMEKSIALGYPVLLCGGYSDGLPEFLNAIEQKVVIILDEYEKTFNEKEQERMLSVFDGVVASQKMFVVTSNDSGRLNKYLIDRPGRFHYSLNFDFPTPTEVIEYIVDNADEPDAEFLNQAGLLSLANPLTYDTLRAICEEYNDMLPFNDSPSLLEVLEDINVAVETGRSQNYNAVVEYSTSCGDIVSNISIPLTGQGIHITPSFKRKDVPFLARRAKNELNFSIENSILVSLRNGRFEGNTYIIEDQESLNKNVVDTVLLLDDFYTNVSEELFETQRLLSRSLYAEYHTDFPNESQDTQELIKEIVSFCQSIRIKKITLSQYKPVTTVAGLLKKEEKSLAV